MQKRSAETSPEDMQCTVQLTERDEISLWSLWLFIRGRWPWLVMGLLSGVVAAIMYTTMITPAYESHTTIQVGKVRDLGLIEDVDVLLMQLMEQYGPESGDGVVRKMPYLKKAAKPPGRNNILGLTAVGDSPEQARDLLVEIVRKLIQRHQQIYSDAVRPVQRRLEAVDGQIRRLAAQGAELGGLIARLKDSQPMQASLIAMERSHLYRDLNDLERDRVALQQQIIKPYSNPSEVIVQAALPREPASPKKLILVLVGIVLGLTLSLVAIFFREAFRNRRTTVRRDAQDI